MKFHALMQIKGPHQPITRSLPGFGNAGHHIELCIELYKPIKHLLRYRGSIDIREESRIKGERFLPEGFMIYPTISWHRYGRLALAGIRLTRLLTAHSKDDAATAEIEQKYPPPLSRYHGGLARTVCFVIRPCIPAGPRIPEMHVSKQKRCRPIWFYTFLSGFASTYHSPPPSSAYAIPSMPVCVTTRPEVRRATANTTLVINRFIAGSPWILSSTLVVMAFRMHVSCTCTITIIRYLDYTIRCDNPS